MNWLIKKRLVSTVNHAHAENLYFYTFLCNTDNKQVRYSYDVKLIRVATGRFVLVHFNSG